jgi:hypothetical protein
MDRLCIFCTICVVNRLVHGSGLAVYQQGMNLGETSTSECGREFPWREFATVIYIIKSIT